MLFIKLNLFNMIPNGPQVQYYILHLWPFWRHIKQSLKFIMLHLWPLWRHIKNKASGYFKSSEITESFNNLPNGKEEKM